MAMIRGLKKEELYRILEFYPLVFKKTSLEYFSSRLLSDPYLRNNDIRIVEEEGKIVSSITIFRRKMFWKGSVVDFGGIGNVSTHPEFRGKGFSSMLMQDAIEYIKELNLPILILFTGINSFYEKFGFFTIPAFKIKLTLTEKVKSKYKIRNFSLKDLPEIENLYTWFNKEMNGPIFRDKKYWIANLDFAEKKEIFLVAKNKKEIPVAYIRIVPGHEKGEIWEFAYYEPDALSTLISFLSEKIKKKQMRTAAMLSRTFSFELPGITVEYELTKLAMALILDRNNFTKEDFKDYSFWWTDNF